MSAENQVEISSEYQLYICCITEADGTLIVHLKHYGQFSPPQPY